MIRTTAHGDLLPTAEDVGFYAEHGWWVSDVVVPDEVLEAAQLGAERHYAGERDHELLITGGYLDWQPQHGDVIRLNDYVSLQNDDLRHLVEQPLIAEIAARLAGTGQIRLFHDQLICKPAGMAPSESTVGWHVDAAYWQTCSSRDMLTAWIPFQDCDDDIGAISFIDGSHLRDDTEWMRTFTEHDLTKLERSFAGAAPVRKVPLRIGRGQVSFHHCRTIHGSDANHSSRDRVALALHFQDRANRYVPHTDPSGRRSVHLNDLLCRKDDAGFPDYADPDICPVLWPV
ncbi:phytanoyl-CoA dioxygenase family protein [Amycolatopsis sp. PS_44_ISF1]|uniref:phytanoyl-CoA dioxygenase family protein n=1 Tax=Amycolatopsis sp. PS_44_ISF1 TaxID=2974917 RepID=UPI0028DF4A52|nr:phytanoyl-CoA dioxygenase family protein [Amycolatopsis sp. PS_44_ISF1]MDT8912285.1 phytanoyl-CoA dioxygenase family protein [Amycolatopsis sp. PS_44_ISF1]